MNEVLISAISGLGGALVVGVPWYFRTKMKGMDQEEQTENKLWDRVNKLEARYEALQNELSKVEKENYAKTKEIAMLTARYELLDSEYQKVKTRADELTVENMSLRKRVLELESNVQSNNNALNKIVA